MKSAVYKAPLVHPVVNRKNSFLDISTTKAPNTLSTKIITHPKWDGRLNGLAKVSCPDLNSTGPYQYCNQ